jgi:hypothetical protein
VAFLPRDPRAMSDAELVAWAQALIEQRAPESETLDYKATLQLDKTKSRVELGKDVTSFANQRGGVLLYGVPEEKENRVPVPAPLTSCGISLAPTIVETAENILVTIIDPPLPECHIRVLPLEAGGSLLFIFHPASWNAPHMVSGYKHARYYKRGSFRAVPMTEREVEGAYATRRAAAQATSEFFNAGDFGAVPNVGSFIRGAVCPCQTVFRPDVMREAVFRSWLEASPPEGRRGFWIPFLTGWRFLSYAGGGLHGREFDVRLFHSGATSSTADLTGMLLDTAVIHLPLVERYFLDGYLLKPAAKLLHVFGVAGSVGIRVSLHNVRGFKAFDRTDTWVAHEDAPPVSLEGDISFDEETSASELQFGREAVLRRIMDRLASAFGMWRK